MNMAECKKKIQVQLKEALEINGTYTRMINVPCGQCIQCIERRKMEWGFRMSNEMENSKTAYFVTLTYDNKNVPITKYGVKTLTPHKDITHLIKKRGKKRRVRVMRNDLQAFLKLLRTNQDRSDITIEHLRNNLTNADKIKYYAAGEYGENYTNRPHHHLIIFNASYKNIEASWKMGNSHIVPATKETIAYVMKYLDKHIGKKQDWRKTPEYNTMSEGIGLQYVIEMKEWHKKNLDILYCTTKTGIKIPMPRYYRLLIWNEDERMLQVKIVEETLTENKKNTISKIGQDQYNTIENRKEKYHSKRFTKNNKKRMID